MRLLDEMGSLAEGDLTVKKTVSEDITGAIADSVEEVIDLEPDQIQPAPRIGTHIRTDFIKGMGKRDTQFIMILDIDRVFSAEELASVRGQETSKPLMEVAA